METQTDKTSRIHRSFLELSNEALSSVEHSDILIHMAQSQAFGWGDLLKSKRVLVVSEAGTGKTYECQAEQRALWDAGEAAFCFELTELARNNPIDLLSSEEEERFSAWLASQSDIATFFLDSIDELNLTLGSFEIALKRLNKAIAGQLGRVRIVITTRPIPIDRHLVERLLPIPTEGESVASGEVFADIAMNRHRDNNKDKEVILPVWRNVALMPLSNDQIRNMAIFREWLTQMYSCKKFVSTTRRNSPGVPKT